MVNDITCDSDDKTLKEITATEPEKTLTLGDKKFEIELIGMEGLEPNTDDREEPTLLKEINATEPENTLTLGDRKFEMELTDTEADAGMTLIKEFDAKLVCVDCEKAVD